jgi:multidrug efflux pump subunit AcrA (membrane-fusion protein)
MAATGGTDSEDLDALFEESAERRRWLLPAIAVAAIAAVALGAFFVLRGGESEVVTAPEPVEASRGQLTTTLETTGSATAVRSAGLTFGTAGTVVAIEVGLGDEVEAGQVLARLDERDARRTVERAEISLRQAQLRLQDLVADPGFAEVSAAQQSTASAQAQLLNAVLNLDELLAPPSQNAMLQAQQSVASAESALAGAELTVQRLLSPPTVAEVASADASLAQARASLISAQGRVESTLASLRDAQDSYCDWFQYVDPPVSVCGNSSIPLSDSLFTALADSVEVSSQGTAATRALSLLNANTAYLNAVQSLPAADASVTSAAARRAELDVAATPAEIFQARASVSSAEKAWAAAVERERELLAGSGQGEIDQSRAALASTQAALTNARAREAETFQGADAIEIELQDQSVRLAEISLADARDAVEELTIRAPFAGVVGNVDISIGARVGAGQVAFVLSDPGSILIDITVSEADLIGLEKGQIGVAEFDSIPNQQFILRVTGVSPVPTISQGVVTYPAQAEILRGPQLAEYADQLAVLLGDAGGFGGFGGGGAQGAQGGGGGGQRGGGGGQRGGGGFGGQLPEGLVLPEGVTIGDVLAALRAGEPLPEGVEIPDSIRDRLQAAGGGGGFGAQPGGDAAAAGGQPLPAPGMSASVTILIEVRPEAVLVPTSAVRQLDGEFYVVVPAGEELTERVTVTVGESDGASVEILEGLVAGATVLIGADSEGVPFSATQLQLGQQQPTFGGFGGGGGGFGGGGGGFGGGGGGGQ